MRLSRSHSLLGALAALAPVTEGLGFRDTSPFFLLSTQELPFSSASLCSSASLSSALTDTLSTCPSEVYILVSQPGVHISDLTPERAMPRMRSKLLGLDTDIRTAAVIDQVAHSNGQDEGAQDAGADATSLRSFLETKCGARTVVVDGMSGNLPSPKTWPERPTIIEVDFEAPAAAGRADQLYLNDAIIASLIDLVPSTDYTLLYTTTPVDSSIAFPLDSEAHGSKLGQLGSDLLHEAERLLHLQTKRDIGGKETGEETDGDESAEFIPGGVFERYQFLSPGIFMGLFAGFFFITIIYVAISAITSLEISYGSFARDTSSQAAKKAQ